MPVVYEKRGAIGIVTLSRPQARNAWGADFNEGLARHFAAMEDDDEIRCAILTGDEAGGAFSAGANLKDPQTHTHGLGGRVHQGHRQAARPRLRGARRLPQADDRRGQRLRGRHRLHHHLLLRPDRGVGAGGVAAAAGRARHPADLRRRDAARALGRARGRRCGSRWASRSRPRRPIASASPNGWCRTPS